jgi:uncharacterized membrane protein YbhN (UPF0104 family)
MPSARVRPGFARRGFARLATRPWVRALGGVVILALLLPRVGTAAFLDGVRRVDAPALALAFAVGVLTTVCSAWRWCLVARGLGLSLRLRDAITDYYRALFVNAALPGGVFGDVHRAVRHGREAGDVGRGMRAVALERCAGQIVLVAVGGAVLVVQFPSMLVGLGAVGAVAVVACAAVLTALLLRRAPAGRAPVQRTLARRRSRWAGAVRVFGADARRGLLTRRTWPGVLGTSVVVLGGHLATFAIAAHAAGSAVPLVRLVPLMLLALMAMTLPVNIGGWGPREGVTAWAFGASGLGAAHGVTIAVLYGVFALVASLPGAALLIRRTVAAPPAVPAAVAVPAVPVVPVVPAARPAPALVVPQLTAS